MLNANTNGKTLLNWDAYHTLLCQSTHLTPPTCRHNHPFHQCTPHIVHQSITETRLPHSMSEFSNIRYNQLQPVTTDPITLGRLDQFQLKSGWLEMPFQSSTNRVSTILHVYNYTSLIFCSVQFIL